MASGRFSNQTAEQVAAHLKSFLGGDSFDVDIDSFTGRASVTRSSGGQGYSGKRERLKKNVSGMSPRQRRKAMSAKRREKPKLKHVRNGREITLKGYAPYKPDAKPDAKPETKPDDKADKPGGGSQAPGYWKGPQSMYK